MSLLIGVGAVALSAYIGRKFWLAFHNAVGIKPGKVTYLEPQQIAHIPKLIAIDLDEKLLSYLPEGIHVIIKRIDSKADKYQSWKKVIEQSGRQSYLEEELVVAKLLSEHLPNILTIYVSIRLNGSSLSIAPNNQIEAYDTLIELLNNIEGRLDALLQHCESVQLQDLKVMKRYLNSR